MPRPPWTNPTPAKFTHNSPLEIAWTVVPILILIFIGAFSLPVLFNQQEIPEGDVVVKATGYQWKWHYKYLGQDVEFFSNLATPRTQITNREDKGEHYLLEVDEPLVVPVGTKVRFLITAADVIHSWWVPALAVKKDAIPGFINESWTRIEEPGIYRGQCTELCGKDHGFMPVVVEAKSKEDFAAWLAAIDSEPEFDSSAVGVVGYCMTGAFALRMAAWHPERIRAAAGFHSANLAKADDPNSPVQEVASIQAQVYLGHADGDALLPPDQIARLDEALAGAGVHFCTELYKGAGHGYTAKDAPVYDARADARHFKRLLTLFEEALSKAA